MIEEVLELLLCLTAWAFFEPRSFHSSHKVLLRRPHCPRLPFGLDTLSCEGILSYTNRKRKCIR